MEQSKIPRWCIKTKTSVECFNTLSTQIELLPRLSIIYGFNKNIKVHTDEGQTEIIRNGIAIEWLWFAVFISKKRIK